jgi:hypothetical protein
VPTGPLLCRGVGEACAAVFGREGGGGAAKGPGEERRVEGKGRAVEGVAVGGGGEGFGTGGVRILRKIAIYMGRLLNGLAGLTS